MSQENNEEYNALMGQLLNALPRVGIRTPDERRTPVALNPAAEAFFPANVNSGTLRTGDNLVPQASSATVTQGTVGIGPDAFVPQVPYIANTSLNVMSVDHRDFVTQASIPQASSFTNASSNAMGTGHSDFVSRASVLQAPDPRASFAAIDNSRGMRIGDDPRDHRLPRASQPQLDAAIRSRTRTTSTVAPSTSTSAQDENPMDITLSDIPGVIDTVVGQSTIRVYPDISIGLDYSHGHLPGFLNTYQGQIDWLQKNVVSESSKLTEIMPHPKTKRNGVFTTTRTFTIKANGIVKGLISFRTKELNFSDIQDAIKVFNTDSSRIITPDIKRLDTPDAKLAEKEGIFVYFAQHINGVAWEKMGLNFADPLRNLSVVLPTLAKLLIAPQTYSVSEYNQQLEMIARHHRILHQVAKEAWPYLETVRLPMMPVCPDLDNKSILITSFGQAVGIVGFGTQRVGPMGAVRLYPMGMNLAPIHRLSGYVNTDGSGVQYFFPSRNFKRAEENMWSGVWHRLPSLLYEQIVTSREAPEAIDHAMRLGTILDLFNVEKAADGIMWTVRVRERAYAEALPLFMSYRSPASRGAGDSPYDPAKEEAYKGLIAQALPAEPWRPAAELVAEEATPDNIQGAVPLAVANPAAENYQRALLDYEDPFDPSITNALNIPPAPPAPAVAEGHLIVGFPDDVAAAIKRGAPGFEF
ncbi:hypothetical protein F5X68DRAFT_250923 [Plectosphaerella plurivora]|uniref:Uncharacterized protein n=1 Tax=Plectosphaerella plurivora TaxID=936078 RepID=A0A9P8VHV9_9PEZI|nr:hypothetical protein F5X68DRAFT_250923 [Plectosphaerella plurivora]